MDEDEAMFSARFQDFERSNRSGADQGRRRQAATKKVSETYHLKRAKREKEAEIKRLEQEMKQKQTDDLNAQFARLIEESKQLKEKFEQEKAAKQARRETRRTKRKEKE